MKKSIYKILFILLIGLTVTGCSGAADYRILLIDDYYVAKTSAHNAKIFKVDDKDTTGNAPSIPIYIEGKDEEYESESVVKVGQDDRYIIAQTNIGTYYILDTKEEYVMEFLLEDDFNLKKKELDISEDVNLKNLDEYEKVK